MKRILFAVLAALLLCLAACEEERAVEKSPQTEPALSVRRSEKEEEIATEVSENDVTSSGENALEVREEASVPIAAGTYASADPNRPLDSFTVESVEGNEIGFYVSFQEGGTIGYATAAFTGDVGEFVWSDEGGYQFAEGTILLLDGERIRLNLINNNVTASETGVYEFTVF